MWASESAVTANGGFSGQQKHTWWNGILMKTNCYMASCFGTETHPWIFLNDTPFSLGTPIICTLSDKRYIRQYNYFHAASFQPAFTISLSFSIMYKLHTLFQMQLLVQTYIHTHAHTEVPPLSLRHSDALESKANITLHTKVSQREKQLWATQYIHRNNTDHLIIAIWEDFAFCQT